MEITLGTWFDDIIFTSAFPDLTFGIDQDYVDLELWDNEQAIFAVGLYCDISGQVTLSSLSQILEQYMIEHELSVASFSIRSRQVEGLPLDFRRDFTAVYTAYYIDDNASNFIENSFLTTQSVKTISFGSEDYVSFISRKGEDITRRFHAVFRCDGEIKTFDWWNDEIEDEDVKAHSTHISADDILSKLDEEYAGFEIRLLSFSYSVGTRVIVYYISERMESCRMLFLNAFNVYEMFAMQGVTTVKTKVERDLAVINRRSVFYDRTIEKSYEFQSAALSAPAKDWVEQLFFSARVKLYIPDSESINEMPDVLITESSCEVKDSNSELNRVKFTWQFADIYPWVSPSFGTLSRGIFTGQFDFQFK